MGDEYYAEVTRIDDGKTFPTCPIYPTMVVDSVIPYPYAEIIPGEINLNNPVAEIKCLEEGSYQIYNFAGMREQGPEKFTPPSEPFELKFNPARGIYYIVIFETTNHNRRHVQRIRFK